MTLMTVDSCSVCGNTENNWPWVVREMMFGRREPFHYLECGRCGCFRLQDVPADLGPYYPPLYDGRGAPSPTSLSYFRRWLYHQRARFCLGESNLVGKWLTRLAGRPKAPIFGELDIYALLKRCHVRFDSRILDVGCGFGYLLLDLNRDGFASLLGADPFIEQEVQYPDGVTLAKRDLLGLDQEFDFIMLHHSFEHLPDPLAALRQIHRLLRPGCYSIIRTPIAGTYAWHRYGVNWAQLDAPRHLFVHSVASITLLAEQAGLRLEEVEFDSTAFQFWASEQYVRDIPLRDERSYMVHPQRSIFTPAQIAEFEEQARRLNRDQQGDSACFYLKRE